MSCYESVEEYSTDYCCDCVHSGDSECHWCRDDTPSGIPSLFETESDYLARLYYNPND